MSWANKLYSSLFNTPPVHEAAGRGRRAQAWRPSNPGAVTAILQTGDDLRAKSRDLARRNNWAYSGIEAFVSNAIGTGIKPQSMAKDANFKLRIQELWTAWTDEADFTGQTDFYGLQILACRAMIEGGECFIRLVPCDTDSGMIVPLQLQILEAEHLPYNLNHDLPNGNLLRSGIEFSPDGKRLAYHLYRTHPHDGGLTPQPMGRSMEIVRVDAAELLHLYRVLRPGQIRGEPWLSRALVTIEELDQYTDAELVRMKTAATQVMSISGVEPEDSLPGEQATDSAGVTTIQFEPGAVNLLRPGQEMKMSDPPTVGGNYELFVRSQLRAVAAAIGVTYEQLSGDLTGVNYSSIRAGMLEFRRKMEAFQHNVIVHQLCRPVWNMWLNQAVLSAAIPAPGYALAPHPYRNCKWIPQGWSWVDPQKEYTAMQMAVRSGFMSRSDVVSTFGYDAVDVEKEIAIENARADQQGLVFDTDARKDKPTTADTTAATVTIDPSML